MRFYRYWVREEGELRVDGIPRKASCFGHSDTSEEHAREQARERLAAIQARTAKGQNRLEGYEPCIREEVVRTIDARNLISRNRYGAQVLNSEMQALKLSTARVVLNQVDTLSDPTMTDRFEAALGRPLIASSLK